MLCPKCGALIADDSVFCSKCGAALKKTDRQAQPVPEPTLPQPVQPEPLDAPAVIPETPVDPVVQYTRIQDQNQPQQGALQPPPQMPATYLVQNILLTVFAAVCCITIFALPTAVTGLVFSGLAQSAWKRNDFNGAQHNIKLARIFMWISFGIEIASAVIYIVLMIIGVMSFASIFNNIFKGNFNFNMDQFKDFSDGIWR